MLDPTFHRPIAHRGLHDVARGLIENTASAFEAAIAAGCAIECDVRPASDATPMVHHDVTLDRVMQAAGPIGALSPAALARLPYKSSQDRMLSLDGLLELVAGRVALLIEIKNDFVHPDGDALRRIATTVSHYNGPAALMSFDPDVMVRIRRLAPGVPRGLVAGVYRDTGWWSDRLDARRRAALSVLTDAERADIAFTAYHVADLPQPAVTALRQRRKLAVFAWTVRSASDRAVALDHADAPIFEGEIPSMPAALR